MRASSGQTQVLTAVLLGGILVVGVAGAYIWGVPLLQKNRDTADVRNALDGMTGLSDGIAEIARQGGSRTIPVALGQGTLSINPENETVTFQTQTQGAYVTLQQWAPLNENDMQGVPEAGSGDGYGIRGVDSPGVVIGRAVQGGDEFLTTYRLIFRRLHDPSSGQTYQIDLVENGRLEAANGNQEVVVQRQGTETIAGAGVDGAPLNRIQVRIRIS